MPESSFANLGSPVKRIEIKNPADTPKEKLLRDDVDRFSIGGSGPIMGGTSSCSSAMAENSSREMVPMRDILAAADDESEGPEDIDDDEEGSSEDGDAEDDDESDFNGENPGSTLENEIEESMDDEESEETNEIPDEESVASSDMPDLLPELSVSKDDLLEHFSVEWNQETDEQKRCRERKEKYVKEGLIPTHARYMALEDEFQEIEREYNTWKNSNMPGEIERFKLRTLEYDMAYINDLINKPLGSWTENERENKRFKQYFSAKTHLVNVLLDKEFERIRDKRNRAKARWERVEENQRIIKIRQKKMLAIEKREVNSRGEEEKERNNLYQYSSYNVNSHFTSSYSYGSGPYRSRKIRSTKKMGRKKMAKKKTSMKKMGRKKAPMKKASMKKMGRKMATKKTSMKKRRR